MKRGTVVVFSLCVVAGIAAIAHRLRVQPVREDTSRVAVNVSSSSAAKEIPAKNQLIVAYTEAHGREIAPEYYPVVCTEFLIKIIDHFTPLGKQAKRDIRIITEDDLSDLVNAEADVIKGVQVAFMKADIGKAVRIDEVCAGDFVQFWDTEFSLAWGHCGIVHQLVPGEYISVYSSHPITSGYGIQRFPWPKKIFFARLK